MILGGDSSGPELWCVYFGAVGARARFSSSNSLVKRCGLMKTVMIFVMIMLSAEDVRKVAAQIVWCCDKLVNTIDVSLTLLRRALHRVACLASAGLPPRASP